MFILTIGDVVSQQGLKLLEKVLNSFKRLKGIDFTVVNGENVEGMGINPDSAERLFTAGADVVTLGNHAFSRYEMIDYIENSRYILRPANMTYLNPGVGYGVYDAPRGLRVGVICLMGRVFMDSSLESPFFMADRILKELDTDIIVVDIHAEATSEKAALARYLDGRVSCVFGTHTHVLTADDRVFPGGTGFITDIGMTGPVDSVLGMEIQSSIDRLLGAPQVRYKSATGACEMQGVIFEVDERSGLCLST